ESAVARGSAARPVPPELLEEPAARAVADRVPRLDPPGARHDRRGHRLPQPRGVQPEPRHERDRPGRGRPRVPAVRLADVAVVALRAQPGPPRHGRVRRGAAAAGQAVERHPAAVQVAAGRLPGGGHRARGDRAARRLGALPVRHRRRERPDLLPVQVQLRAGALLRGDRVRGGAGAPRRGEDAGDPAGVPGARRAQAAARRPRAHRVRAARPARRPGAGGPGRADDLAPRPRRGGRRGGRAARGVRRRSVGRRAVPVARALRAAPAVVPGQQDRAVGGRHRGDDRRRLAPRGRRSLVHARRAPRDAAAHGVAADRVRRRVVDDAVLDRRPAAGPRRRLVRHVLRRVVAAPRFAARGHAQRRPGGERAVTARAEGQRRGPLDGPRLPGAHHRAGAARRAQHQVGQEPEVLV
ncbi:MAG: PROBABLE CONSERVED TRANSMEMBRANE PROTEIN, partial [uncultured Solirubrobacteraceae bacterium]